ncbi:MAG: signal peptidase I [Luteolibacter sp.]
MFTPKWKKEALFLAKNGRKFVDYKRDLLTPERVAEIESRRRDLLDAIKAKDRAKVDEASKQLRNACEKSLPCQKPQGWFEENVEVMFVAIVIALGLRAYYLQPFRIPTGSMQPTLNGLIGTPLEQEKWPAFPRRMTEKVLRGRTYVKVINDQDRKFNIRRDLEGRYLISSQEYLRDTQYLHFFSRSLLLSENAPPLRLPSSASSLSGIGLERAFQAALMNRGILPKGAVICEGYVDSGDLVLVDKFSYHFRKPERGEVFVFDTRGIKGIKDRSTDPQGGNTHYIKRLCGVPGDTISIRPPHLLVDGKIAEEPGIRHVSKTAKDIQGGVQGYVPANKDPRDPNRLYLWEPSSYLTLAKEGAPVGLREYVALGDNTGNSLDSRYWGTVKEYNLVGPALFSLWPITSGHWGFIH